MTIQFCWRLHLRNFLGKFVRFLYEIRRKFKDFINLKLSKFSWLMWNSHGEIRRPWYGVTFFRERNDAMKHPSDLWNWTFFHSAMSKINWSTRVDSPVKTLSTDPGEKTTRTSRCLLTQLCVNERMIFRGSNNATVRRRRAGSLLSGTCVNNRGATGGPRIPERAAPTMIDLMASISTVNTAARYRFNHRTESKRALACPARNPAQLAELN